MARNDVDNLLACMLFAEFSVGAPTPPIPRGRQAAPTGTYAMNTCGQMEGNMALDCIIRKPGSNCGGAQWRDLKTVTGYYMRVQRNIKTLGDCDIYIERNGDLVWSGEFRGGHCVKAEYSTRADPKRIAPLALRGLTQII